MESRTTTAIRTISGDDLETLSAFAMEVVPMTYTVGAKAGAGARRGEVLISGPAA